MTTNIKINLLKHHPGCIPMLAKLWHELLGKQWEPDTSIPEITSWLHGCLNDQLPLTYIALNGGTPVGMCSLEVNDGIRSDLIPWLCDLCVDEQHQHKGIGRLLVIATQNKAKALGFNKLYLFVLDLAMINYYKKLGWEIMDTDVYKGHHVIILQKVL